MRRFRRWRRRSAALALATVAATTPTTASAATGDGASDLRASANRVGPGAAVTLRGHFRAPRTTGAPLSGAPTTEAGSQDVRIEFRALGSGIWRADGRTRSGRRGTFEQRVRIERSGRFRAVSADGRKTAPEKIRVRSTLRARVSERSPTVGESVAIRGRVAPGGSRRRVTVRVGGETIRTKTTTNGAFEARWKAASAGRERVTVKASSDSIAAGSATRAGAVTAFRPAVASYYGPGLYGNQLACGGTLQPGTVGVANKSLPCGTKLTVRYGHREVQTKVIDRGPYVAGREFDLTEALRNKLGFGSTGTVLVSR